MGNTMFYLGVIFLIGLSTNVIAEEPARNISKIERFIYDRCRMYSSEASAFDEFKKHMTQFSDYLSYTASLLPNGKQQFCSDERPRLVGLMGQLSKDMKPCFPAAEKYFPKFIYESFVEFLNFVCRDKNMENFFSTQGSECRSALKSGRAGEQVGHCFKKLFASFNSDSSYIKKDALCLDLKLAKTCFGEAIAQHCPNFAGYESLNEKFFAALRKQCNSAFSFGVSSLLVIVSYVSTKIFS